MGVAIITVCGLVGLSLVVGGLAVLAHHVRATRITLRFRILRWVDLRVEIRRD